MISAFSRPEPTAATAALWAREPAGREYVGQRKPPQKIKREGQGVPPQEFRVIALESDDIKRDHLIQAALNINPPDPDAERRARIQAALATLGRSSLFEEERAKRERWGEIGLIPPVGAQQAVKQGRHVELRKKLLPEERPHASHVRWVRGDVGGDQDLDRLLDVANSMAAEQAQEFERDLAGPMRERHAPGSSTDVADSQRGHEGEGGDGGGCTDSEMGGVEGAAAALLGNDGAAVDLCLQLSSVFRAMRRERSAARKDPEEQAAAGRRMEALQRRLVEIESKLERDTLCVDDVVRASSIAYQIREDCLGRLAR